MLPPAIMVEIILFLNFGFNVFCSPCPWPPLYTIGREALNRTVLNYDELVRINYFMENGYFTPKNCTSKQRIAVIIPYRDREPQLKTFLLNVLPRLFRQQIEFGVYLIEQSPGKLFNKGALINIGYLLATSDYSFDCFIIHDVDIIPEDDRNYYTCSDNPRHLAVKVQQFGYRRPYPEYEYIGGILALTRQQMTQINGVSNLYSGWGMEDDDIYRRILSAGFTLERPKDEVSYCGSVKHPKAPKGKERCHIFLKYDRLWQHDGLNSIEYTLVKKRQHKLFKSITVDVDTNLMRQKMNQDMKTLNRTHLPPPQPHYNDDYCKWMLNTQAFNLDFTGLCRIRKPSRYFLK